MNARARTHPSPGDQKVALFVINTVFPVDQKGDGVGVADADGVCVNKVLKDGEFVWRLETLREYVGLTDTLRVSDWKGDRLPVTDNVKDFVCRVKDAAADSVSSGFVGDTVNDDLAEALREKVGLEHELDVRDTIGDGV
jgi:hypothetical protein